MITNVVFTLLGGIAGYYASKISMSNIVSKAIDLFVDIKWAFKAKSVKSPVIEEPSNFKWLSQNEHYKMYELNGKIYITFNHVYDPSNVKHFDEHTIEDIVVIKTDGTKVNPSSLLIETLAKCGGHGCSYKSGVPTVDQLRMIPSISDELKDVQKIVINTSAFEEHIIRRGTQVPL